MRSKATSFARCREKVVRVSHPRLDLLSSESQNTTKITLEFLNLTFLQKQKKKRKKGRVEKGLTVQQPHETHAQVQRTSEEVQVKTDLVVATDAVAHPEAMVVKPSHTSVAMTTVLGSQRPYNLVDVCLFCPCVGVHKRVKKGQIPDKSRRSESQLTLSVGTVATLGFGQHSQGRGS